MQIEKILLHVSDVASLLGVSSQTVYHMIHNGELRSFKSGKVWKIPTADIEHYLKLKLSH